MHRIDIRRAYEPPGEDDGQRVLVDRLWPRGVSKEALKLDAWLKDLAPSTELRKWFGHDPAKWDEFRRRYTAELEEAVEAVTELRRMWCKGAITLVYGAKDEEHNDAVVLRDWLRG